MGVEYVVGFDCAAKSALGLEKVIRLIRAQNQAAIMLTMARQGGSSAPPSEIRFRTRLETPDGVTEKETSVQDLLDSAGELRPFVDACSDCPANVGGRPFGCYSHIAYPLKVKTEEWLMARLPATLDCAAGKLLRSAVADFKYDGGAFKNMRNDRRFFEGERPVARHWGKLFSAWEITSNQILQMMFGLGNLQPSHSLMLALFLGLVPHDTSAQALQAAVQQKIPAGNSLSVLQTSDGQLQSVIGFLNAVKRAAELNTPVWISM